MWKFNEWIRSPGPHEDPGAAQRELLHAVARAVALVEPPLQGVAAVMALLAEVVAAAVRAVEALEAAAEDRHHAAAVAADARVDRVLRDAGVVRVVGGRGFPRLGDGSRGFAAGLGFLPSQPVVSTELSLHVLLELDADERERPRVRHSADAAAVAGAGRGARLAHEVPAVHRHGLVQELPAHLACENRPRGGRGRGCDLGRVVVLVALLGGDLLRAGFVFARVNVLQELVQLRGDPREVHIRFLAHRAVRHRLRVHGSVHAPEAEHVPASLNHRLVG
jgi:hypothetical protein